MEAARPTLTPVYFQTTRSAVRYAPKGGYADEHVRSYVEALSKAFKKNVVAFTGVSEDGRDLAYIEPDWWSGQTAEKRDNFLLKPCGGSSNPTANTGETETAAWLAAFRALFQNNPELRPQVGAAPLFSIIDADTAHHLSAPLVERAVTALGRRTEGWCTVVINFDKHWDYSGSRKSIINCQKWGYFAVYAGADAKDQPLDRVALADAYVHFGGQKDDLAFAKWHPGARMKVAEEGPPPKPSPFGESIAVHARTLSQEPRSITDQIRRIRESIPSDAPGYNAYVTCDRDFMKRNFTPWNDGYFEPETGMSGLLECLSALRDQKFNLIGFDITGLPDVNASANLNVTLSDAADMADLQIRRLWQEVSTLVAT